MKRIAVIPIILAIVISVFSACSISQTKTDNMTVNISGSDLYSQKELNSAVKVIENELSDGHIISSILRIEYCGDTVSKENLDYCNTLNSSNNKYVSCAVFETDFITTDSAGEEGFNEDDTYYDFSFYLAKTNGGDWEIVTSGYA